MVEEPAFEDAQELATHMMKEAGLVLLHSNEEAVVQKEPLPAPPFVVWKSRRLATGVVVLSASRRCVGCCSPRKYLRRPIREITSFKLYRARSHPSETSQTVNQNLTTHQQLSHFP
jgi:hypothetical protein